MNRSVLLRLLAALTILGHVDDLRAANVFCGQDVQSGGHQPFTATYSVAPWATYVIDYQMYEIPDRLAVRYRGTTLKSTSGRVSGGGTLSTTIPYGLEPSFTVEIDPYSTSNPNHPWYQSTLWTYTIRCTRALTDLPGDPGAVSCGMMRLLNISRGQSQIDNIQLSHWHEAVDYGIGDSSGGCGTCGGVPVSGEGQLPAFEWKRVHRYVDSDRSGSFGPGVFSNYDIRLSLHAGTQVIDLWDPMGQFALHLERNAADGWANPSHQLIQHLRLFDADGEVTTAIPLARIAEVVHWDQKIDRFEIFSEEDGSTVSFVGRLIERSDANGNAIVLTYQHADPQATTADLGYDRTALWKLQQITDAYQRSATFTYGRSQGMWVVTAVACPNATTVTYSYDDSRLIGLNRIVFPTGEIATFDTEPDERDYHQKVMIDDPGADGTHRRKTLFLTATAWGYDDRSFSSSRPAENQPPNRIRKVLNGEGEKSYENWIQVLPEPDENGADFYIYAYEGFDTIGGKGTLRRIDTKDGLPVQVLRAIDFTHDGDPADFLWELDEAFAMDDRHFVTERTEAGTGSIAYTYDDSGKPTRMEYRHPDGTTDSVTTTIYNAARQPVREVDELGRVTVRDYDAGGEGSSMLAETVAWGTPDQATRSWTYTATGQVLTSTDFNQNVTNFEYDETGYLTTIVSPPDIPGGPRARQTFEYDNAGRLAFTEDAENRRTTYHYDGRNRLIRRSYGDGSAEHIVYGTGDHANLVIERRDRNGNRTVIDYDQVGRVHRERIVDPVDGTVLGERLARYVGGTEQLAATVNDGETTLHYYDDRGREIRTVSYVNATDRLWTETIYDVNDRIRATIDPYGRATQMAYDRHGRVIRTVRDLVPGAVARDADLMALARDASLNPSYVIEDNEYDAAGQTVAVIDGRGIRSTLTYDSLGRLVVQIQADQLEEAQLPEATMTRYVYDAQGNQTEIWHPRSFIRLSDGTFTQSAIPIRTIMTYTGRNLVETLTEAFGTADAATVVTTYTLTGQRASQTDPRNSSWLTTFGYGACCDRLVRVTDPLGNEMTFAYDAHGNRVIETDANGIATRFTYDARHRLVSRVNGLGEKTSFLYDTNASDGVGLDDLLPASALSDLAFGGGADGSLSATITPLGAITVSVSDGTGRVVRTIDPLGQMQTVRYDRLVETDAGILVATDQVDALGKVVSLLVDGNGHARVIIDPEDFRMTQAADAVGRVLRTRDANGVGGELATDGHGRVVAVTKTGGTSTTRVYDAHGNVVAETDPLGESTYHEYDSRDRRVRSINRFGELTERSYDAAGRLIRLIDPEGGETLYAYDLRGLLTEELHPAGTRGRMRTILAYDPAGRQVAQRITTDSSSAVDETAAFTYDAAHRLVVHRHADGTSDTFIHDAEGRVTSAVSQRSGTTVERTYDIAGRLTREHLTFKSGIVDGDMVSPMAYTTTYLHDVLGRPIQVTAPDGRVLTRSYTARGQLSSVEWDGDLLASFAYDAGGRPLSRTTGNGVVESRAYVSETNLIASILAPSVLEFTYEYDASYRKTEEADGIQPSWTQQFGYDVEGRLTSWSRSDDMNKQTWSLSPVGDWQTTTRNGTVETRLHTAVHEVVSVDGAILSYDGKGNLIGDNRGRIYTWTPDNRLNTARIPAPVSPTGFGAVAMYQYDAFGRRVSKTVNGRTTRFLYDGHRVITEVDLPAVPTMEEADHPDSDGALANLDRLPANGGILSGSGVIRLNYQPALEAIPVGYLADKGKPYGMRTNGLTYGWSSDATGRTVTRYSAVPLPEMNTFAEVAPPETPALSWGIALPNGTYPVIVVSGDPLSTVRTNHLTIGGIPVTDVDPATGAGYHQGDFDGYAVQVEVTDGMMTITDGLGALSPTLCFVEIGQEGSVLDAETLSRLAELITAATDRTGVVPQSPTATRSYAHGAYLDDLIAYVHQGVQYFSHSNHLFSVASVTDVAGQVVERYHYDAYGVRSVSNAAGTISLSESTVGQSRGLTGHILDQETGLYHARRRPYDPSLGRFISKDPLGYIDGLGLYFAYFIPNEMDPSGTQSLSECFERALKRLRDVDLLIAKSLFEIELGRFEELRLEQQYWDLWTQGTETVRDVLAGALVGAGVARTVSGIGNILAATIAARRALNARRAIYVARDAVNAAYVAGATVKAEIALASFVRAQETYARWRGRYNSFKTISESLPSAYSLIGSLYGLIQAAGSNNTEEALRNMRDTMAGGVESRGAAALVEIGVSLSDSIHESLAVIFYGTRGNPDEVVMNSLTKIYMNRVMQARNRYLLSGISCLKKQCGGQ